LEETIEQFISTMPAINHYWFSVDIQNRQVLSNSCMVGHVICRHLASMFLHCWPIENVPLTFSISLPFI